MHLPQQRQYLGRGARHGQSGRRSFPADVIESLITSPSPTTHHGVHQTSPDLRCSLPISFALSIRFSVNATIINNKQERNSNTHTPDEWRPVETSASRPSRTGQTRGQRTHPTARPSGPPTASPSRPSSRSSSNSSTSSASPTAKRSGRTRLSGPSSRGCATPSASIRSLGQVGAATLLR